MEDRLRPHLTHLQELVRAVTSVPTEDNPCLAFDVAFSISKTNAERFAKRIYDICKYVRPAFLDPEERPAKIYTARSKINELIGIPCSWQINRIAVLEEPTIEFYSAFSLVGIYRIVNYLEQQKFHESEIVSVLSDLVVCAFVSQHCSFFKTSSAADTHQALPQPAASPPQPAPLSQQGQPTRSPINGIPRAEIKEGTDTYALHQAIHQAVSGIQVPKVEPPIVPQPTPRTPPPQTFSIMEVLALAGGTLPKFSGVGELDVEDFFIRLENWFDFARVTDSSLKLSILKVAVERVAQQYVNRECKANGMTYAALKAGMTTAFAEKSDPVKCFNQLQQRYLKPNEKLRTYIQDMIALCLKYDPDMSAKKQIVFVTQGLPLDIQRELSREEFETVDKMADMVDRILLNNSRITQVQALRTLQDPVSASVSSMFAISSPAAAPPAITEALTNINARLDKLCTLTAGDQQPTVNAMGDNRRDNNHNDNRGRGRGNGRGGRNRGRGYQRGGRGRGNYSNYSNYNNYNNNGSYQGNYNSTWNSNPGQQQNSYNNGYQQGQLQLLTQLLPQPFRGRGRGNYSNYSNYNNYNNNNRAALPQFNQPGTVNSVVGSVVACAFCGEIGHDCNSCAQANFS